MLLSFARTYTYPSTVLLFIISFGAHWNVMVRRTHIECPSQHTPVAASTTTSTVIVWCSSNVCTLVYGLIELVCLGGLVETPCPLRERLIIRCSILEIFGVYNAIVYVRFRRRELSNLKINYYILLKWCSM